MVGAREEKYFGYPATERGVGLLTPREECTDTTQRQCNSQRPDEETATQVIHNVAQQQSEPFGHNFTLPNEVSDGIPIFDPRFRQAPLWKTSLDEEISAQPLACIIHVVEGAKSLLCYKHVVKTVFGATKEASA